MQILLRAVPTSWERVKWRPEKHLPGQSQASGSGLEEQA